MEDKSGDTLLYAGGLKLQVTDWFFLKKNIELKYIGMENALIKFQRKDSVWNHQFISDLFSSPEESAGKGKGGLSLKLKNIDLEQITFLQKDAWWGEDKTIRLGHLALDAEEINFSEKRVKARSLFIANPEFIIENYPRLKPRTLKQQEEATIDSLPHWNREGWVIRLKDLQVSNGIFKTKKASADTSITGFNGKNIEFHHIDAAISDVQWTGDSLTARLDLKTKERSGLEVKKFISEATFTPQSMIFSHLDLQTNNSIIRDYFKMGYNQLDDMGDFIQKVQMAGNFDGTEIDSDDIAFFAPGLKHWKKRITLKGNVRGTVNDLVGQDLVIQAGSNTRLTGEKISLSGLPDINLTFIHITTPDFKTTYADAVTFFPELKKVKTPDLKIFNTIHYKGDFTGFIHDFVSKGSIQTPLGIIKTDLNIKLPIGHQPEYSGDISTPDFRLGEFLKDPNLGAISFEGEVNGTGFSAGNRNVTLNGKFDFIDYNKYRYSGITVNGNLDKQLFNGKASINDPNAELTLDGKINLSPEAAAFNLSMDVKKANLQPLGLLNKDLSLSGNFNFGFTGKNIDEFFGRAGVTNANIFHGEKRLPFDSLVIIAEQVNGERRLSAVSNEFTGMIAGNYRIKDLPDAFSLFLSKYYPAYIKTPGTIPEPQSFSFEFTTNNTEDFLSLVNKDLGGFGYSHVSGRLDMPGNRMELKAEVPGFSFRQFVFSNAEITGEGTLEKLTITGKAGNIKINDSLQLPQSTFTIEAANDNSRVNISTTANQPINHASIKALVQTHPDGVVIKMDSSSFSLSGKQWIIDKNGILDLRKKSVETGRLVLRSGEQEINFQTEPSAKGNRNDWMVNMKKLNLGDFSPFILPKNRLEGLVSGTLKIEDPQGKLNLVTDLRADQLLLDNDSLGSMTIDGTYDNSTGQLKSTGRNLDPFHKIEFDLSLFLKNKEDAKKNLIRTRMESYPINILERFLGQIFSDVEGYITGPVEMAGPLDELNFSGTPVLKDGKLKVKFTQCTYQIKETPINIKPGKINFNGITLTDPVSGNPVFLEGSIDHHSFTNMIFAITATTRRPLTKDPQQNKPVLLLNTTVKDNPQFYGKAYGTGSFSLFGPESELYMKIDAIASARDSSNITIPPSSSKESGIADFLVERKFGKEMSGLDKNKNTSNIVYDADLVINPAVNLRVILDAVTNDEIKGRGEGTLNIHSGTNESLKMRGRFNILDGNYLFTFQSFFKRPFELRKGSENYIEWADDPYAAKIHFDAAYKAEKVSFAPLVTALNLDPSLSRIREDVYVVANLSGNLFTPDFKFRLDFPPNSKVKNDPSLSFNFQQLEKNPNEINRQVTYLIVFNSFAPIETGNTSNLLLGSTINEFAYSTISSIIFNQVNRELNKALSRLLKTDNISINFSGSVYNRNLLEQQGKNSFNINQGNVNINVPISFFKDRFIIVLGSTLDVPLESNIEQTVQFLPDVTAEWLINQSGTVRATFFYRQDIDILTSSYSGAGRTKRSGASISYRKEFDTIKELFGNKKRKKTTEEPPSPN